MLVEVRLEREGLVAARANERLRVGVGLNVGPKVGLVGEGLLAHVAGERFFAWNEGKHDLDHQFFPLVIPKHHA